MISPKPIEADRRRDHFREDPHQRDERTEDQEGLKADRANDPFQKLGLERFHLGLHTNLVEFGLCGLDFGSNGVDFGSRLRFRRQVWL